MVGVVEERASALLIPCGSVTYVNTLPHRTHSRLESHLFNNANDVRLVIRVLQNGVEFDFE